MGHMKTEYEITRVISNKRKGTTTTARDKNGKTLSIHEQRKKRWKEHFEEILNRQQPENYLVVDKGKGIKRYSCTLV